MTGEHRKHIKIRFGRDEHTALHRLPSAEAVSGVHALHGWARIVRGAGRFVLWLTGLLMVSVLAAAVYLYAFGVQNAHFTAMAAKAIQSVAGPGVSADLADARLSIDKSANLAFEASGITLTDPGGRELARLETVTLGLRLLSLLGGTVEISDVAASGLAVEGKSQTSLPAEIVDANGRLLPGNVTPFVNRILAGLQKELDARKLDSLTLENARFGKKAGAYNLHLNSFSAVRVSVGGFELAAEIVAGNQTIAAKGNLTTDAYSFDFEGIKFGEQVAYDAALNEGKAIQIVPAQAIVQVNLSGTTADQSGRMRIAATVSEFDYQSRRKVRLNGNAQVVAEITTGSNKIEILKSNVVAGSNRIEFTGAVGPNPQMTAAGDAYRFELVSNNSRLMPNESPETATKIAFRAAGTLALNGMNIDFSELGIRTESGELIGRGSVEFGTGSPELIFSLTIPKMRITEAKNLWPAIFASGARRWVLAHVFGGEIRNSQIDVAFAHGTIDLTPKSGAGFLPTEDQVRANFLINGARVDVLGDLPPIRDADAEVTVAGANTSIAFKAGTAFLENGETVAVKDGILNIPVSAGKPVIADINVKVEGGAASVGDLANRAPINAFSKAPVLPTDLSGNAVANIKATFPLQLTGSGTKADWSADVAFTDLAIAKDFSGQKLSEANGTLKADKTLAVFEAKGKLNGVPATVSLKEPLGGDLSKRELTARLKLDDKARNALAPGLADLLKGPIELGLLDASPSGQQFEAILDNATLSLPWAGWTKGAGIAAKATFTLVQQDNVTRIKDLIVRGESFSFAGDVTLNGKTFSKAVFSKVALNKGDAARVNIVRDKGGYSVDVSGSSLDLRGLLKRVSGSFEKAAQATGGAPISLKANLNSVTGFNGERLSNVIASYNGVGSEIKSFGASASSSSGGNLALDNAVRDGARRVTIQTTDGGALLRFMDIYDKMLGGRVNVNLVSSDKGVLSGEVDARNFTIVGEARLKTLAGTPTGPDGKPISAAGNKIDVSRVGFERGNATIEKGKGYLKLKEGILRSSQFGLSYAGTLYDPNGRIAMTGTFLPIYGLNRIFGELPIFGEILGNGRDNGLIGITFKLAGDAKDPKLEVNPISLIAPGIFRKIFEFQ